MQCQNPRKYYNTKKQSKIDSGIRQKHTNTYVNVHINTHTLTHIYIRQCVHTYILKYTCVYIYTYINTYAFTLYMSINKLDDNDHIYLIYRTSVE